MAVKPRRPTSRFDSEVALRCPNSKCDKHIKLGERTGPEAVWRGKCYSCETTYVLVMAVEKETPN